MAPWTQTNVATSNSFSAERAGFPKGLGLQVSNTLVEGAFAHHGIGHMGGFRRVPPASSSNRSISESILPS
jgi:hypothetical protein